MEQLVGLGVVAIFAFIMWLIHENTQAALDDPGNKKAIYLDQLGSVSELRGRGRWSITIIRQSGDFYSSKEVYGDADAALAAAVTSFRRAKIDGIGIIKNSATELHFGRLFHNHRGSNEGKKIGQAIVSLIEAEELPSRLTRVPDWSITMTCDCGARTQFPLDAVADGLTCPACGKVEHLNDDQIIEIRNTIDTNVQAAQARIDAGESSVEIEAPLFKSKSTEAR